MRRISLVALFTIIISIPSWGQDQQNFSVKGRIVDAESNNPIPFVSIGLKGSNKGTVSNENGEFMLESPELPADFIFSHLSYNKDTIAIPNDSLKVIKLNKTSITLREVVFKGDDYIASLLTSAYYRLSKEYDEHFFGEALYRQVTTIDQKPSEMQEIIYDARMNNSRVLGTKLKTGRYAAKEAPVYFANFSFLFKTASIHQKDDLEHISLIHPKANQKYDFELIKFFRNDNKEIAEIAFGCQNPKCSAPLEGLIYIDTETYAVKRFEATVYGNIGIEFNNLPARHTTGNYRFKYIMNFTESNSKNQIDYIHTNFSFDLEKRKKKQHVNVGAFTYFYNTSTNPTDIDYSGPTPDISDRDAIKNIPYDGDFWKDHPVVQRTSLEDEIINAFESKGSFGNMISN